MSVSTNRATASPPRRSTVARAAPTSVSPMMTLAPSVTKRTAMAAPMPRAAPITTATRPSNLPAIFRFLCIRSAQSGTRASFRCTSPSPSEQQLLTSARSGCHRQLFELLRSGRPCDLGNIGFQMRVREGYGLSELRRAVETHQHLHDSNAVREGFGRHLPLPERLYHMPVLVSIAVYPGFILDHWHQSLFRVLLLHQIFALSASNVSRQKNLETCRE